MTDTLGTARHGTSATRRGVLRAAVGAGSAAMAAPLVGRYGHASSGELYIAAWGDYNPGFLDGGMFRAFENATGIKITHSTYGSNEEIENKLRAAGGKGFDILFPSVDTGPNYYKDDLLRPIDESKLAGDRIIPAILRNSVSLGATHRGRRYLVPFDWGTEAVTWDSVRHPDLGYGKLSYGDLFAGEVKSAVRQKSILVSLALYLDAAGIAKTDRGMDLYKSEDDCRRVFEACLRFASERKKNIGAFWNNGTEATSAFTDAGCTIGQTWDNTGTDLNRKVDARWRYTMPNEGGLAWLDCVAIPAGARNVEQAYAFVNFLLTPEAGATFANTVGYNSVAKGVEPLLSDAKKASFEMSYPDQAAIDRLWWWPMQTPAFAKLRPEYVEKLTNA